MSLGKFWTVRGSICVGCGEEHCSRQGAPEQRTTGDQSPWVSILHWKECFHQNWNGEYEMECTQRDRMTDMVAGYHQRNERQRWLSWKVSFLWLGARNFLRSGVTCSCLLLRKTILAAWFWIFITAVHLIRSDVSEWRVAIVQTTENGGARQLNSGFPRQEMAIRANSFNLKICWTTNVISMLCHWQGSVM